MQHTVGRESVRELLFIAEMQSCSSLHGRCYGSQLLQTQRGVQRSTLLARHTPNVFAVASPSFPPNHASPATSETNIGGSRTASTASAAVPARSPAKSTRTANSNQEKGFPNSLRELRGVGPKNEDKLKQKGFTDPKKLLYTAHYTAIAGSEELFIKFLQVSCRRYHMWVV